MQWFFWALSSAFFAGVTALLAKIGVSGLNSNLATAIRTSVILIFSWAIVFVTSGSVDVQFHQPKNLDLSRFVRRGNRAILALLFSGASDW